ncbi:MAG: hypothetical protein NTW67_06455, partial [Candidatus Woesearchaeota archaeon]|nr:hypothetical protein [Candidatus Woesearchaeota archaeon]
SCPTAICPQSALDGNASCSSVGQQCRLAFITAYYKYECQMPAGVTGPSAAVVYDFPLNGYAVRMDEPASSSSSFVLVFVAAFGILFVTLLNFIHRE